MTFERLEGKEVTPIAKPGKPAPVTDLMAALKQSLAQTEGKKKPAASAAREVAAAPARKLSRRRA